MKRRGKGEPQATNGAVGKEGMNWIPSKPTFIYSPRIPYSCRYRGDGDRQNNEGEATNDTHCSGTRRPITGRGAMTNAQAKRFAGSTLTTTTTTRTWRTCQVRREYLIYFYAFIVEDRDCQGDSTTRSKLLQSLEYSAFGVRRT
jgi:hypothetical protein